MRRGEITVLAFMLVVTGGACSSDDNPAGPSSNGAEVVIVANNGGQSFSPNPAPLGGRTVAWRNNHGEIHRIVANDGSFDTGNVAPGATSSMVQLPAGGLNYHCEIHPTMVGAIGGAGGAAPPPCSVYCE